MRASNSEQDTSRSRARRLLLAVLGGVAFAGCILGSHRDEEKPERPFHHYSHISRGLECTDCHADVQTATGKVSMPKIETCRECHNADSEQVPPEVAAALSQYAAMPEEAWHERPASFADVRFVHMAHVGSAQISCQVCHGAFTEDQPNPVAALAMNACLSCHKERTVSVDCSTCHAVWSRDYKPPTHSAGWQVRHGLNAEMAMNQVAVARVENCALCHTRSSCDQCHAREKPRDHTESWRTVAHGLAAAMDRSRCMVCHTADTCERCHMESPPPTSHRAGFGAPQDTHCLTCHEDLDGESCSVCHKGTPSHLMAAAKPASHTAGMNCRQCHGHAEPLPHPDNGSECNSCHH